MNSKQRRQARKKGWKQKPRYEHDGVDLGAVYPRHLFFRTYTRGTWKESYQAEMLKQAAEDLVVVAGGPSLPDSQD